MKKSKEVMTPEMEETMITAFEKKKRNKILEQSKLPHHLFTYDILTRLPIKTFMKLKCVSKQWYSTISSHHFTSTLFKLSPYSNPNSPVQFLFIKWGDKCYLFNYEDYEQRHTTGNDINGYLEEIKVDFGVRKDHLFLVGSCNGLLCFACYWGKFFIIWNPIIRQWKKIEDPYALKFGDCWCGWGFGYVSSIDDYKVVRLLQVVESSETQVHVFSLRTNKWTRVDSEILQQVIIKEGRLPRFPELLFPVADNKYPPFFLKKVGVLANETLYFTLKKSRGPGSMIVDFDLVHETFNVFLQEVPLQGNNFILLCSMGGRLCTCQITGRVVENRVYADLLMKSQQQEVLCRCSDTNFVSQGTEDVVGFTRTGDFFIHVVGGFVGVFNANKSSDTKYTPRILSPETHQTHSCVASYVPSAISPLNLAEFPTN